MNENVQQQNWSNFKNKIKARFGKLTDQQIDSLSGNIDQLEGKIQRAYGYTREQAKKEFDDFKSQNPGLVSDGSSPGMKQKDSRQQQNASPQKNGEKDVSESA
ncbi:MAG TPA: CsbD family protein [Bdellovibrionota bacterium]|jgi:uncharacterized protein YjbJ (UPF0337 family)|nr:CsbD family protein [Bdellovibrionota bacterium]